MQKNLLTFIRAALIFGASSCQPSQPDPWAQFALEEVAKSSGTIFSDRDPEALIPMLDAIALYLNKAEFGSEEDDPERLGEVILKETGGAEDVFVRKYSQTGNLSQIEVVFKRLPQTLGSGLQPFSEHTVRVCFVREGDQLHNIAALIDLDVPYTPEMASLVMDLGPVQVGANLTVDRTGDSKWGAMTLTVENNDAHGHQFSTRIGAMEPQQEGSQRLFEKAMEVDALLHSSKFL